MLCSFHTIDSVYARLAVVQLYNVDRDNMIRRECFFILLMYQNSREWNRHSLSNELKLKLKRWGHGVEEIPTFDDSSNVDAEVAFAVNDQVRVHFYIYG